MKTYVVVLLLMISFTDRGFCQDEITGPAAYWSRKCNIGVNAYDEDFPPLSPLITFGNLTSNLPANFPEGSQRYTGITAYLLFTKKHNFLRIFGGRSYIIFTHVKGIPIDFYTLYPQSGTMTKTKIGQNARDGFLYVYEPGTYVAYRLPRTAPSDVFTLIAAAATPELRVEDVVYPTDEELRATFPRYREKIAQLNNP